MKLIDVTPTPKDSKKKYIAELCKCNGPTKCKPDERLRIQFGSKGSMTFTEGATEKQRDAYIARHSVREDWSKANPGSLSRYVLWSAKSIKQGIINFNNKIKC